MQGWEDLGVGKTCCKGHCTVLGSSPRLRCKRPKRLASSENLRNLAARGWRLKDFRYPYAGFRCNAKICRRDLEAKHEAKGNGGVLHVVSVREPSLTTLKELHFNPYAGYRRVQFQKKKCAKQFQNPETLSRSPKDDETREAVMDTAEPGTSADTEKPATSSA